MNIPSELEAAIEACYRTFQKCTLPGTLLDVCTHCCMDAQLEAEMHRLPLRQISQRHMYEYNGSAKSEVQPTPELRYLIPRLLELVARGEEVHHSTELYLDRLGRREADAFSPAEWQTIQHLCECLFAHRLSLYPWQKPAERWQDPLFDLLLMFAIGGVDIAPMLAQWRDADAPQSTLHYVESSYWNYWYYGGGRVNNAFADDRYAFQATMCAWLDSAENRAVFVQRILALDLDALPGFNSWCCGNRFTARELVEYTFDALIP